MDEAITKASTEVTEFLSEPNAYRSILILLGAIVIAYIASRFLAQGIIYIAQRVATHSDSMSDDVRAVRLRQVETYLSITVALVRAAVVIVVAYIVWRLLSPLSNSGIAAIGASAFFVVFAGQTVGMILRDVTAGVVMITEQWFHVGDYIKVEPFLELSGVVERFTLRSTKIRTLSGEVVWIHNQQIQAVHVVPKGVRTYTVDVFARDADVARVHLQEIIDALSASASLVRNPFKIGTVEPWGNKLWRIEVKGQTAPGREWLIENFFVNALKEVDEDAEKKSDKIFVYEPIVRFTDPVAERKFKRAIRVKRES